MSTQTAPKAGWVGRSAEAKPQSTPAELERVLEELAHDAQLAESFLASLASSLFPNGATIGQTTWPERTTEERPLDPEARLRAAELRFRTLVEQIPAVTFMAVLGEGKNEIYVSPHIEQMLGFTQQEWLENPFLWYWQLHPDDRALWNDEFSRGCRTGGPFRADCRFLARDGRTVWVHGEARLVRDALGRPSFLQGVAFDITEIKRAQEVLVNEAVRTAKAEEELAIARRVQLSILPRDPRVDGLEIGATMIPATDVGGDYYDVLPAPDGCWVPIGDVAGHGLNAGLVMLMMQSAISALSRTMPNASPRDLLLATNEVMVDGIRARLGRREHVTFTLFRYHRDGRFVYAGAHEDILVFRKRTRTIEQLETTGAWVGARVDVHRAMRDEELRLEEGDVMLLYTDGVTEAMNASQQLYDIRRLRDALLAAADLPATEICARILADVRAWMAVQDDDITLVALRYLGDRGAA